MHRVGVVGFRGYSGAELVQILERHPAMEPVLVEHRADAEARPTPRGHSGPLRVGSAVAQIKGAEIEAVLLATPHEVSMELVPELLGAGLKVVDLSAAYRLEAAAFKRWYKEEHKHPELLHEAAYGLPEVCRERLRGAKLIANPGCYPTAANLAIRPLVRAGLLDLSAGIVCDAKSGTSGAGRKPSLKTSFCEVVDNFSAYAILEHRHVPEVLMTSGIDEAQFSFTAQLLPLDRGILATIYARVVPGVDAARMLGVYEEAYASEPFVRLYDHGVVPDLRAVQRTNFCDIGFRLDAASRRLVVASAIDNLVKGAAGQAVQNLNLMLGRPETEGLL